VLRINVRYWRHIASFRTHGLKGRYWMEAQRTLLGTGSAAIDPHCGSRAMLTCALCGGAYAIERAWLQPANGGGVHVVASRHVRLRLALGQPIKRFRSYSSFDPRFPPAARFVSRNGLGVGPTLGRKPQFGCERDQGPNGLFLRDQPRARPTVDDSTANSQLSRRELREGVRFDQAAK
jgi:hypothetical protein